MKSSPRRLLVFLSETMTMEVVLEVGSTLSAAAYLFAVCMGLLTTAVSVCGSLTPAESPARVKVNVPAGVTSRPGSLENLLL